MFKGEYVKLKRFSKMFIWVFVFSFIVMQGAFAAENVISNILKAKVNVKKVTSHGVLLDLSGTIKGENSDIKNLSENAVTVVVDEQEKLDINLAVKINDVTKEQFENSNKEVKVSGVQNVIEISKNGGAILRDDFILVSDELIQIENKESSYIAYIGPKEGFDIEGDTVVSQELKLIFNNKSNYNLKFYSVYAENGESEQDDNEIIQSLIDLIDGLPDDLLVVKANLEKAGEDTREARRLYNILSDEQKALVDQNYIEKLNQVWGWTDMFEKFGVLDATNAIYNIPDSVNINIENLEEVIVQVQEVEEDIDKLTKYQLELIEYIQDDYGNYLKPLERLDAIKARIEELEE